MNYIQQLNAFEDWIELNYLPATEELLWRRLFRLNNMFGWAEWFFIDNLKLAGRVGISERALIDTRLNLKHKGLIDFISGKKGKPTRYKLTILYKNTEPISVNTSVNTQNTEPSSVETSVKTSVNSSVKTSANINNKPKLKTKTIINNYTANALLVEAIQDFIEMRNKIKKPLTDRALSMMFTELNKLVSTDEEKITILNQSTLKCWQGVFPLKDKTEVQNGTNYGRPSTKKAGRNPSEVDWENEPDL